MTITLTNAVVRNIIVDYEGQVVQVVYTFVDANGKEWGNKGTAYFFVTMPAEPPNGYPDSWFQLPPSYIPIFLTLKSDAETALTTKFLG